MVAPARKPCVRSDPANGNEIIVGADCNGGIDSGENCAETNNNIENQDDLEEQEYIENSETAKMLQQTRQFGTDGNTGGAGRSSRSSPIYVSVPTDDITVDTDDGILRRRCPLTVCDLVRDILFQYHKQLAFLVVFGVTGTVFLTFSRQYVFKAIEVLKHVDVALQCTLFLVFFVVCSFPLMWGYIVLVITAGFLHGAVKGSLIVIVCAGAGVTISHLVLSSCLRDVVKRKILPSRNGLKALINAVDGVNGMRVVCLARLTPIPFGIQNAVFAISVLPRWKYVAASMLGLLPGQIIEAYIGSSLKNLGELYSHRHASPMNVTIVAIQIGITLCLFYYLFCLAKKELNKITTNERGGGGSNGMVEGGATLIPDSLADEAREAEIRFLIESNHNTKNSQSPILADHVMNIDNV